MKTIALVIFIGTLLGSNLALAESFDAPTAYVPSNRQILIGEANKVGIDPLPLLKVAMCESTMNPKATNGSSFGILQFIPSTFKTYAKKLKIDKPDIWNVQQQAQIASYMFKNGQAKQWTCAYLTGVLKK